MRNDQEWRRSVSITLSPDLLHRIDEDRNDVPRSRWIENVLSREFEDELVFE